MDFSQSSLNHNDEFPADSSNNPSFEARSRKFTAVCKSVFGNYENNMSLLGSIATVFGIGVYEGMLLSKRKAPGRAVFCLRYGAAQLLPSIIWLTKPAELIALSMKRDPTVLLKKFKDIASGCSQSASKQLFVHNAQTLRSVLAGFVGIAQILRLVDVASLASDEYETRVKTGQESFLDSCSERVIRLAGSGSDVTEYSLDRFGRHIVPIVEGLITLITLVILITM